MSEQPKQKIHGRGAVENPTGRFERLHIVAETEDLPVDENDGPPDEKPRLPTQIFRDTSKSIISTNDSPDVGMEATINP